MIGQSEGYRVYMKSPEWAQKRKLKLKQVGYRCQGCGSDERLEVHHLSYARFGYERPEELQVLCHICHAHEHGRAPSVGPIAGPTARLLSAELLRQQKRVAFAARVGEVAADFELLRPQITDQSAKKRCRLIRREFEKLIDELASTN